MTRFYVDTDGGYIGGFHMPKVKGKEPRHPKVPVGSVEVPEAPRDARQVWAGGAWGTVPPGPTSPQDEFKTAVQAAATLDELKAVLSDGYL